MPRIQPAALVLTLFLVAAGRHGTAQALPEALPDAIGTTLLAAPVVVKAGLPIVMGLGSLVSGASLGAPALLLAAWTLPNSFLLANVVSGKGPGIRTWRLVNLAVDGLAFAGLLGLGLYTIAQPSSGGGDWGDLIGALGIAFSIPFGAAAALDLVPFPAERKR